MWRKRRVVSLFSVFGMFRIPGLLNVCKERVDELRVV